VTVGPGDEAARDAATDSLTFAFADAQAERYGVARLGLSRGEDGSVRGSALAVLFAGRAPVAALARGALPVARGADWASLALSGLSATVEVPLARWRVAFSGEDGEGFELEFEAVADPAELGSGDRVAALGGMEGYEQPCRVRGTVRVGGRETRVDGLGQRGHAWGAPDWDRIELTRAVSAWTGDGVSAAISAIRPAGAGHHADEALWGALWEPAGLTALDECRLSTTYDAEGRTRRAGFELWPAASSEDEDGGDAWARRGAGEVICGSSLDLGALRLDVAFFRWHLEGREGIGRYDVLRRADGP
jgi:hypothetical protein